MNQAEIIDRLKIGDSSAFAEVVSHWQDSVYNTALGIVQNKEDAEEVAQDVFLKVYEAVIDFREAAALGTWLYKITISLALDVEKSRKRHKRGGLLQRVFHLQQIDEPITFDHPGVQLDNKENARVLFAAVNRLPEKQRLAFLLQKLEGLEYSEVAAVLNCSVAAAESLQARAKASLKKLLHSYYEKNFK